MLPRLQNTCRWLTCLAEYPGRVASRQLVIRAADPNSEKTGSEDKKGVLPGLAQWPPKPITEHGQPKPEDDPQNFAAECVVLASDSPQSPRVFQLLCNPAFGSCINFLPCFPDLPVVCKECVAVREHVLQHGIEALM